VVKIELLSFGGVVLIISESGKQTLPFSIFMLVFIFFAGCTSPEIYRNTSFNPPVYFGTHTVKRGDTLYSIAWRYGRDFRELAAGNHIPPPYIIHIGQKIRLDVRGIKIKSSTSRTSATLARSDRHRARISSRKSVNGQLIVRDQRRYRTLKHQLNAPHFREVGGVRWQWPYVGKVIARYSVASSRKGNTRKNNKNLNKGIDIKGKFGDAIRAAAAGEVVYAGSALRGYGRLIILNHNEHYLSAYGFNKKIFVKEGQIVKAGDVIAEMGKNRLQQTLLHFEIRKDGRPVNPVWYLPKRK